MTAQSPTSGPSLVVPLDAVETVIDWWRSANEAPGGCSYKDAINGMRDAVWALEQARRGQDTAATHES